MLGCRCGNWGEGRAWLAEENWALFMTTEVSKPKIHTQIVHFLAA